MLFKEKIQTIKNMRHRVDQLILIRAWIKQDQITISQFSILIAELKPRKVL